MSKIVDQVRDICLKVAQAAGVHDAQIVAPLPVWDGEGRSMGVQIKAARVIMADKDPCEVVGNFVLTMDELKHPAEIHRKASIAVMAMAWDVQVKVRPLMKPRVRSPDIVTDPSQRLLKTRPVEFKPHGNERLIKARAE